MGLLEETLRGKSLADYTNSELKIALNTALYTNTADMWSRYLVQQGYSGSVADMMAKWWADNKVPAQFRNYINSGLYLFNPQNLFAANEPGYLYDLDDLSTVFLDSAGTTPATVNGLVGLVLDKSKGLALGAELVTNGDFSSATGWNAGTGWTISGGVASATGLTADGLRDGIAAYTTGRYYRVSFDKTGSALVSVLLRASAIKTTTDSGRISFDIQAGASATRGVEFYLDGAGTIDNVSVVEIQGNHRYQATTGSKPILRGTPTGANLASGASWTAGTGWSVAGDTATATTSSGTLTAASIAAVVGKHYRVTYTITRTAGSIQPTLGGRTGTAQSASGTYVQYFDNATSTAALVFTGTGFTGTVTLNTIEAVDVSAGSVAAPYALQYDGVDDFLQTASVDFSATDKVTVCHGVRKLSDAVSGIFVELSADFNANNAFAMIVPDSANSQNLSFGIRQPGIGYSTALASVFPSAESYVVSASADRALPTNEIEYIRKNGSAQSITRPLNQNLSGSFGNHSIYFGRRGGVSAPYNGLMFSSVCIGRLLTAAELANTERWVARKTGLTL